jgi:flagellar basal-body rod protein FlgC
MSVFDTLRIAGSGLTAQRLRMDVAASNIANAQTAQTATGGPYKPESVWFEATQMGATIAQTGVTAAAMPTPNTTARVVYDPRDPAADADGFVRFPDVDIAAQMADLMGSARSYSMNATVVSAAKQNALDALDLGR